MVVTVSGTCVGCGRGGAALAADAAASLLEISQGNGRGFSMGRAGESDGEAG